MQACQRIDSTLFTQLDISSQRNQYGYSLLSHLNCKLTASVNIFSHAIGAALFITIPVHVFRTEIPPRYAVATLADKIVCSAYFLGVAVCFMFSVVLVSCSETHSLDQHV